jgi:electron transfer flavoprotein alpha subunit
MNEILVLAEHRAGKLQDITFELLAKGDELATELGVELTVVLLGWELNGFAKMLSPYADNLLLVKDKELENFNSELYQSILTKLISERNPLLVLLGHTAIGIELAPSLAIQNAIPLITDCLELKFVDSKLEAIRQMYSGKINASVTFSASKSYLATLRPGVFEPRDISRASRTFELSLPCEKIDYKRFIKYLEEPITTVDITKSDIVVGVGRGIKEKENLALVEKLASALGGVLAGSRPVIDKQWLSPDRQVGSSGKIIKPRVYFAIGISGAFQHVMGMKDSELIIAINKDPNAPIFEVAHYGIVGDLFKVLPLITQKITELKSST